MLLQSYRDDERVQNPFRDALASLTDTETTTADTETIADSPKTPTTLSVSFAQLFAAIGQNAPFESSHLLIYTLLYTNVRMRDAAIADPDSLERLVLPLLETLYHARSVAPSRLYLLVIVLLTFTQDAAFVRAAHTHVTVRRVPWYTERYMLEISLGSLLIVLFTRLIWRNITHFHDSFLHLNAFAALSNLARSAENLHVTAAQGIVGLIELLAKKEAQLGRAELSEVSSDDAVAQKRTAYVEFVRLLLGVVSSCLKAPLLPRNPQLVRRLLVTTLSFE